MKCTNCGSEITDGDMFCTGCGMKVSEMQGAGAASEPVASVPPVNDRMMASLDDDATVVVDDVFKGAVKTPEPEPQKSAEIPFQEIPAAAPAYTAPTEPPKKKHGILVLGILAVIAILVIVAIVFILKLFVFKGNGNNEKKMVYQKDGVLYYVPNMDKDKDPVEIDELRDEGTWDYEFSDSGKYLYYVSEDDRRELYRAQVGKMKAGSDKNSKYIDEIDSKVVRFDLLDDERLLYLDSSDRLYYYNGKQETEIDRDVTFFTATEGNYVYYAVQGNGSVEYYYYDISKNDGDSICKDIAYIDADWENGLIYARDENEIYRIDRNGEEETLIDGVSGLTDVTVADEKIYYVAERMEEHTLYDFVDDPYASADAGISEPVPADYLKKVSESNIFTAEEKDYYSRFPDDKKYYVYYNADWDSTLGMSYYRNRDDEVFYYDSDRNQWYEYDVDAYNRAYDEYYAVADRINLREELKQENYTQTYYDLYVWSEKNGEQMLVEAVNRNSLNIDYEHQILTYCKMQTDAGEMQKISIDSIYDTYDVEDMLDRYMDDDFDISDAYDEEPAAEEPAAEEPAAEDTVEDAVSEDDAASDESVQEPVRNEVICYAMVDGHEQELDIIVSNLQVSEDGKTAMLWTNESGTTVVYSYQVGADGLKEIGTVGEDIVSGSWSDDSYYFTSGIDGYGDLTVYRDQKEKVLVKNVYLADIRVFDDGNTTAFKDYDDRDLRIFNSKGEDQKIASDVESYQYVNEKRIVYRKNDNLYVYTGKDEDRRIVRNLGDRGDYWCFKKSRVF